MQRLYKRRKSDSDGNISSNWSVFSPNNKATTKRYENDDSDYTTEIIFEGGEI